MADWLEEFGSDGIDHFGLDLFGGDYVHRRVRGGSGWSKHAFGCAVDIDPDRNGLWTRRPEATMPEEAVEIANKHGWINLGQKIGRDWMHFQATQ